MKMDSFLAVGGAFLLGATASMWVPNLAWLTYILIGLFICIPFTLVCPRIGTLCVSFLLGLFLVLNSGKQVLDNHIHLPTQERVIDVLGTVDSYPQINEWRSRFEFEVVSSNQAATFNGHRLLVSCYECPFEIERGQQWRLTLKLKPPHGYANAGSFDYEKWLLRHRIHATAYVRESSFNALLQAATPDVVSRARLRLKTWLQMALPTNSTGGVLAQALMLGDRSGFSDELWSTFRRTGVAHMFAISGLHVGLVWLFASLVVRWITCIYPQLYLHVPAQFVAGWAGVLVATSYAALSGWGVPVQRAILMLVLFQLNRSIGRRCCPYHGLLLIAVVLLLFDPLVVLDLGYWMSCYAVLVLICLTDSTASLGWKGAASLQVKLNLLMAPLVLLLFNEVSLLSPLINFILVPLVGSALLPALLISTSLYLMGAEALASLILQYTTETLGWVVSGLQAVATLEFSAYQGSFAVGIFAALLLGLMIVWRYNRRIAIAVAGTLTLTGLIFTFTIGSKLEEGEFAVHVLDVGQGLSVVVQTKNKTMLYDTGARFANGGTVAASVVLPWLRHYGIRRLDYLVISHADNDHIGGLDDVMKAVGVAETHTSVEKLWGDTAFDCSKLPPFAVDGVRMEYLNAGKRYESANNQSCVLKLSALGGSFLLNGDIEKLPEGDLVETYQEQLNSDVMLVPHHGSKTSSRPVFINAVAPRDVVISSGFLNSYGHPAGSVVSRYLQRGIRVSHTVTSGTISYLFNSNGIQISNYRNSSARYWRGDGEPNVVEWPPG